MMIAAVMSGQSQLTLTACTSKIPRDSALQSLLPLATSVHGTAFPSGRVVTSSIYDSRQL